MGCFKRKQKQTENEEESRKPSDAPFKQQKMKAWQPVLTASTVLPIFFLIGVIFLPIGITLLVTSNNIKEQVIEYTDHSGCKKCIDQDKSYNPKVNKEPLNCTCVIKFSLKTKWEGDVYFYYGLSNFYQNHRRYVRSRDDGQLHGELKSTVNSNCKPFDVATNKSIPILPCGAVANSMFNDSFSLKWTDTETVKIDQTNIAWKSDRETKFKNPKDLSAFDKFAKPLDWQDSIKDLQHNLQNEPFIVWMRVAAFPTFRKFYGRLNRNDAQVQTFRHGLKEGEYALKIKYYYPVMSFGGKKRFILTTSSWIGGKNSFLGTCYIVIGCLCLLFGFVFLFIHMKRTKGGNAR